MKKKIVAMMLASMMAFNLIGCGETQKESNAPEEKQESIESEEEMCIRDSGIPAHLSLIHLPAIRSDPGSLSASGSAYI